MNPARFDRFTRAISTRLSRRAALQGAGASLAGGGAALVGSKALGQPATPAAEIPARFLYVQSFAAGRLTPATDRSGWFQLALTEAPELTVAFADRPAHETGMIPTGRLPDVLPFTADDPPNASLTTRSDDGLELIIVVELLDPAYDPDNRTMSYLVRELQGYGAFGTGEVLALDALPEALGVTSLFIDSGSGSCNSLMQLCGSDADCCSGYHCVQANCTDPNGVTFGHAMCYPSQD